MHNSIAGSLGKIGVLISIKSDAEVSELEMLENNWLCMLLPPPHKHSVLQN